MPKRPSRRNRWLAIALAGAIGAGAIARAAHFLLWPVDRLPHLVSPDTYLYATVAPTGWLLVSAAMSRPQLPPGMSDAGAGWERTLGISFARDVRPWLGREHCFAVEPASDGTTGALFAFTSRNDRKARACLSKVAAARSEAGDIIETEMHVGVPVKVHPAQLNRPAYAFALIGDVVAFSSSKQILFDTIERATGGWHPALADNPAYAYVLGKLTPGLAHAYLKGAGMPAARPSPDATERPPEPAAEPDGSPVAAGARRLWATSHAPPALIGVGATIVPRRDGVSLEGALVLDPAQWGDPAVRPARPSFQTWLEDRLNPREPNATPDPAAGSVAPEIYDVMPADALISLSLHASPQTRGLAESLFGGIWGRGAARRDGDALPAWLDGDMAIALLSTDQWGSAWPGIGTIVRPTNLPALQDQLQKSLGALGGRSVSQTVYGSTTWSLVQPPYPAGMLGGYAIDPPFALMGLGQTAVSSLAYARSEPLSASPSFRRVARNLPNPNSGIFFIDVARTSDRIAKLLEPLTGPNQDYVESTRPLAAIGAAAAPTVSPDGVMRATLFLLAADAHAH